MTEIQQHGAKQHFVLCKHSGHIFQHALRKSSAQRSQTDTSGCRTP